MDNVQKIKITLLIVFAVLIGSGYTVPENYYYMKDNSKIVYFPKSADRAFSLTSSGQPINITGNTIYGYYQNDIRVTCPVYDQMYYTRTGQGTIYLSWDPDTFETNLNFIESKDKQVSWESIITALLSVVVFLELISFNAWRVRKGNTKL